MAELVLTPAWGVERLEKPVRVSASLGDGYDQSIMLSDPAPSWRLSAFFSSEERLLDVLAPLRVYSGDVMFQWSPYASLPLRDCVCEGWSYAKISDNLWKLDATFLEIP